MEVGMQCDDRKMEQREKEDESKDSNDMKIDNNTIILFLICRNPERKYCVEK